MRTLTLLDNSGITWFPNKSITQTASTADYGGAIEIRELNKGGVLTGDWHEGPRIDLHWGNRVLRSFGVLADGNFHRNGSKIWDAANDGAGSGLDADLLDGRQGNTYMSFQRLNIDANNYTSIGVWESKTSTNMPTLNSWHQVMSWGTSDSNYALQMVNTYTTDCYLYFRHKIAGSWKDWRIIIDKHYIGFKSDYQHVVFLLWRDKEQTTHQVVGKIYTENGGSQKFQLADLNLWHSRWGSLDNQKETQCQMDTTGHPFAGFTLVTCTYQGEKWWALKHTNNQAVYFYFQGYSSQNISFEKVVYYTSNTSTVNNSEIYNSIVDRSNEIYRRYTAGYAYMLSIDVYQKSESDSRYVNVSGDTMTGQLTVNSNIYSSGNILAVNSITTNNWFYTNGTRGWYNTTYGGGIYMNDTSYVKVYNNKHFRVNGLISCGEYQDDAYGYMNVTRPTDKNYCCYAFVKSGMYAFGIGYTTNNTVWIGTPNNNRVMSNLYMELSTSQVRILGSFVAAGEVTAYSTSDMRLKKDIREVEYKEASFVLSKVRPVKYKWNDKAFELNSNQRYKGEEYGIIAQELLPIIPCAIKTVFDEYMSIDYTRLIPPIIAVVNEHELEIQRLKAEIKQLKERLAV